MLPVLVSIFSAANAGDSVEMGVDGINKILQDLDVRKMLMYTVGFFFVLESYLRLRKRFALKRGYLPALKGIVTEDEYQKSYEYNMYKNGFGFITDTYSTVTSLVVMMYWPVIWRKSSEVMPGNPLVQVLVFSLYSSVIEQLLGLPVALLVTFHIEEKFGFNKHTFGSFAGDTVKGFLVNQVVSGLLNVGMLWTIMWAGPNAWFYLWVFITIFALVMNTLYPIVFAPLFNKFTPLEDGKLKDGIDALIEQTGLDCKNAFMVDGSKQSSHSNAYVAGFFCSKRIVIYDTLVKDLNDDIDMIKAVVGHEIGHSIMNHNWMLLGMSMINFFLMFFSFGFVQNAPSVVTSFGFTDDLTNENYGTTFLKLHCFLALYSMAIMPTWSVMQNFFVRQLEFSADRYAVYLGYDINSSLKLISKANKSDFNPDWLHSMYHHSHPPLLERLAAADKYKEQLKMEQKKKK
eukprot:g6084.t1